MKAKRIIKRTDNAMAHFCFIALFCFVAGLFIALYGAGVFVQRDFLSCMLLKNEFVFMDYEEPKIRFYLVLFRSCRWLYWEIAWQFPNITNF